MCLAGIFVNKAKVTTSIVDTRLCSYGAMGVFIIYTLPSTTVSLVNRLCMLSINIQRWSCPNNCRCTTRVPARATHVSVPFAFAPVGWFDHHFEISHWHSASACPSSSFSPVSHLLPFVVLRAPHPERFVHCVVFCLSSHPCRWCNLRYH